MMLQKALDLAARGFKVFPIKPGMKAPPLLAGWPTRATSDPDTVRSFWSAVPEANIGVHTAGLLVLDIDVKSGGFDSFCLLDDIHSFPMTLRSDTPSGGVHLFYRLPEGHSGVPNSVQLLGPGLDVRSTGGYVVAPGSTVAAGEYKFQHEGTAIADAPSWLVEKLGTVRIKSPSTASPVPPAPESALDAAQAWLEAQHGAVEREGGDVYTFTVACGLRDRGVSESQAVELLTVWNAKCAPPWSQAELEAKVRNAYKYGQNEPGARVALPSDFDDVAASDTTPERVAGNVAHTQHPSTPRALRLAELVKDRAHRRPYLVKGMLWRASHALMFGAPGEGKSFLALDIAYHVAAGRPWMDRKVRQGPVIYLAFEGYGGMMDRGLALRQHYGDEDVPLYVHEANYNLRESQGRRDLAAMIAATETHPALIVVDTLAHAIKGGDENSAQDMGAITATVGELIRKTGACVLLVHHSGKNKNAGARGSSALLGAIDTQIEIDEKQIKVSKQRDGALAEPIGFALQSMVVDVDEDGDDITSCVVLPDTTHSEEGGLPRISGNARHGFDVLCDMAPANALVDLSEWRDACGETFLDGKKVSQRFYDLLRTLRTKGYVVVEKGKARRRLE